MNMVSQKMIRLFIVILYTNLYHVRNKERHLGHTTARFILKHFQS